MDITILGAHNTETDRTRLPALLIDGVLALDAGGLTSALSLDAQRRIQAVVLTHQHFDHIRDVALLGLSTLEQGTLAVYGPALALDALTQHIANGTLYPDFRRTPSVERPSLAYRLVEPNRAEVICGFQILPVRVDHSTLSVGYQVADGLGKRLFYTGDTGPGIVEAWPFVSPELLLIDVTMPNRFQEPTVRFNHLTPSLLHGALLDFQHHKDYLPRVVAVHMNPEYEAEIRSELDAVAQDLQADIVLGHEGMIMTL